MLFDKAKTRGTLALWVALPLLGMLLSSCEGSRKTMGLAKAPPKEGDGETKVTYDLSVPPDVFAGPKAPPGKVLSSHLTEHKKP